jgi:hypothetical protein
MCPFRVIQRLPRRHGPNQYANLIALGSPQLLFCRFVTSLGTGELRADRPGEPGKWTAGCIWAAGFASGFNLLAGSHVWLRFLPMQLGSGNLPLVPFGDSLVHDKQYNIPAAPLRAQLRSRVLPRRSAEPPEQIPTISSWPKVLPQPCRAVLSATTTSEIDNTALLTSEAVSIKVYLSTGKKEVIVG